MFLNNYNDRFLKKPHSSISKEKTIIYAIPIAGFIMLGIINMMASVCPLSNIISLVIMQVVFCIVIRSLLFYKKDSINSIVNELNNANKDINNIQEQLRSYDIDVEDPNLPNFIESFEKLITYITQQYGSTEDFTSLLKNNIKSIGTLNSNIMNLLSNENFQTDISTQIDNIRQIVNTSKLGVDKIIELMIKINTIKEKFQLTFTEAIDIVTGINDNIDLESLINNIAVISNKFNNSVQTVVQNIPTLLDDNFIDKVEDIIQKITPLLNNVNLSDIHEIVENKINNMIPYNIESIHNLKSSLRYFTDILEPEIVTDIFNTIQNLNIPNNINELIKYAYIIPSSGNPTDYIPKFESSLELHKRVYNELQDTKPMHHYLSLVSKFHDQ